MTPLAAEPLNHLLRAASWARDRLSPHAGKAFRITCLPFDVVFVIREDGLVAAAADDPPAVTVRLSPAVAMRFAARDESAWRDAEVSGDPALAEALGHVLRGLRWDVEEDLSRLVGDIAARRMTESARAFEQWARASADHLGRNFAEYWTYERPLVASRRDVEQFNHDVDALRDDVARLAKRLELLSRPART